MNFNQKIDWLIEIHGDTFLECEGCETCNEIQSLREQHEKQQQAKCERILAKGGDMKKNDVIYLLSQEVDRRTIFTAMGIGRKTFEQLLDDWKIREYAVLKNELPEVESGQKKFSKSYIPLLKQRLEQNVTARAISKELGVRECTIHYWKKKLNLSQAK